LGEQLFGAAFDNNFGERLWGTALWSRFGEQLRGQEQFCTAASNCSFEWGAALGSSFRAQLWGAALWLSCIQWQQELQLQNRSPALKRNFKRKIISAKIEKSVEKQVSSCKIQ